MRNLQTATLAKTADGLFLVQLPPSMHVNPTTLPTRNIVPAGVASAARNALGALDGATQMAHELTGLDRF